MKRFQVPPIIFTALWSLPAEAQCFVRDTCVDKNIVQIRSQMSITIPVAGEASGADGMKVMAEASEQLYKIAAHECDAIHTVLIGECSLSQTSVNSSLQDHGNRQRAAFVTMSNVYEVRKTTKTP